MTRLVPDRAASPFLCRLERIRDERRWSIAEMARHAGLPARTMEGYFRGHKPGLDALVAMARGFGVTLDFLAGHVEGGADVPFRPEELALAASLMRLTPPSSRRWLMLFCLLCVNAGPALLDEGTE